MTSVLTHNDIYIYILSRRHHSAVLLRMHKTVQGERLLLLSLVSLGQCLRFSILMVSRFFYSPAFFLSKISFLWTYMHFGCFLFCIGSLKGIYDLQGNFYPPNSEPTRGGSRNSGLNVVPSARFNSNLVIIFFSPLVINFIFFTLSGLLATPALVTASSSRAPPPPPPSSMRSMAGGSSMSRALISSDGGIPPSQGPRQNFPVNNRSSGSTEQNRMMSGVVGTYYFHHDLNILFLSVVLFEYSSRVHLYRIPTCFSRAWKFLPCSPGTFPKSGSSNEQLYDWWTIKICECWL